MEIVSKKKVTVSSFNVKNMGHYVEMGEVSLFKMIVSSLQQKILMGLGSFHQSFV